MWFSIRRMRGSEIDKVVEEFVAGFGQPDRFRLRAGMHAGTTCGFKAATCRTSSLATAGYGSFSNLQRHMPLTALCQKVDPRRKPALYTAQLRNPLNTSSRCGIRKRLNFGLRMRSRVANDAPRKTLWVPNEDCE